MPMQSSLPKGSTAIRGTSDVPHIKSLGGQSANTANRLYMFTVRRESLLSKKRSLELRMAEINQQLHGLESNIRGAEGKLKKSLKLSPRRKQAGGSGNGRGDRRLRAFSMKY